MSEHSLPDGRGLEEAGVRELVAEAVAKGSELARLEVSLAKAELRGELVEVVKGAAALIGAGVCAIIALSVLSDGLVHLLGKSIGLGWSYAVVVGMWLLVAGGLALFGRRHVTPAPPRETLQSLHDTAAWARHPTHSDTGDPSDPSGRTQPG